MAVEAIKHIRRLRGGTEPNLMLCSDCHLYVVKNYSNAQHNRVLANEMFASLLASWIGLQVPESSVVYVPPGPLRELCSGESNTARGKAPSLCDTHFGSRFVGGLFPGLVVDYLPSSRLRRVRNIDQFAGMLAFDKWCGNSDRRQTAFVKGLKERDYSAFFIDHGHCFGAGSWKFVDAPLQGVYGQFDVYSDITGWDSFEPALSSIQAIEPQTAWNLAQQIPPEWYEGDFSSLDSLVQSLLARRSRLCELIISFRDSDKHPFVNWNKHASLSWSALGELSLKLDRRPVSALPVGTAFLVQ